MAIGQFMRLTMHNFRMFWSASFSASNRMLVVMAEDEGRTTMDERSAPAAENVLSRANVDGEGGGRSEEDGDEFGLADVNSSAMNEIVQGEFDLDEDAQPPEIRIESHGRRLGMTTLLESLLFVSDEPVEASQLAKALDVSAKQVEAGLHRLAHLYRRDERGLRLQVRAGRYQLVTAPETAAAIEDFLNLDLTSKLSGPALETLAVIAYRQPATRAQIEAVRGVDCAGVLRSLGQRGLIEEVGRLDAVGRPILYGVTDLFMQHFGLIDLGELPPLESDDEDMLWAATKLAEMEQGDE